MAGEGRQLASGRLSEALESIFMTVEENAGTEFYPDYEGPLLPTAAGFNLSRLRDPASLRALAVVIGAVVLILADRTPQLYALVIGAILIVSGLRNVASRESVVAGPGWRCHSCSWLRAWPSCCGRDTRRRPSLASWVQPSWRGVAGRRALDPRS